MLHRLLAALALVLVAGSTSAQFRDGLDPLNKGYAPRSTLYDGLVSYWKLSEASGTRNDSFGTNHLTDVNTVGQAAGKLGDAASFVAASSEQLTVADNASLDLTTAMSISFWLYRDTASADHAFFGKWTFATDGGWVIQSGSGGGAHVQIFIATSAADAGGGCNMRFDNVLTAATWQHVVMIYDGTLSGNSNRLKVYVDGVAASLNVHAGAVPATLRADTATLRFGAFGGSLTRYLNGRLDDVALYNRAITSTEVALLWLSGSGKALYARLQEFWFPGLRNAHAPVFRFPLAA